MIKLEKEIEKPVVKWARANGWLVLKLNVQGRRGWPDDLFVGGPPLCVLMIEFKRPGERPRKLQDWTIRQLQKKGLEVYVCDNKDDAVRILASKAVPRKGNPSGHKPSITRLTLGPRFGKDKHDPSDI